MRKIVACFLAVVLMFGCCSMAHAVTITATNYPLYSIALLMVGDKAEVIFYQGEEPVANGILFCVADEVVAEENVEIVRGTDYVLEPIEGDNDFYTVPVNLMLAAASLGDALNLMDRENNEFYQANLFEIVEILSSLDEELKVAAGKGTVIKCLDGSVAYMVREYGFSIENENENAVEVYTMKDFEPSPDRDYLTLLHEQIHCLMQPK